jgi:dienelactone hydrolase
MTARFAFAASFVLLLASRLFAADDPPLAAYFRAEVDRIAAKPLLGIGSAGDWKAKRPELQRRMLEMLGLWPLPEKTDLKVRITGVSEQPEFVVEKLLFQSSPGLYVTANLYRPKVVEGRLPAVLYVCGHAQVVKDGVIYGNKAHYQHHAAWYAANGYVCLVLDTLQLGELPGLHHGMYRKGMWWWQNRGYTPAGIEAWNGVRAIDYLCTRPEVDRKRIGVTGRSGGGATSWWLGAIDDRLAAVVPVAGITDLRDHVVGGHFAGPHAAHGVIEGHCDCMFITNTYRWDYDTVAALVAPKPLLVENTDADPIFPEGGVRRIYEQLKRVYGWYGAGDRLGLVIGKGGHVDSEEIRHPSFAFMEKWLKGKEVAVADIKEPERKVSIEELKVLPPGEVPSDCRNATIHESFIQRAEVPPVPKSAEEWEALRERWLNQVKERTFAGWPSKQEEGPLNIEKAIDKTFDGFRVRAFDFNSQLGMRLRLWVVAADKTDHPGPTTLSVLDASDWKREQGWIRSLKDGIEPIDAARSRFRTVQVLAREGRSQAFLTVRGIGPTAWPKDRDTHVRRRFYLLGQTLDGMRVWDVRRAIDVLGSVDDLKGRPIRLSGARGSAPLALWAAVFEPSVSGLGLIDPTPDLDQGPAFLNLDRILNVAQAVALLPPDRAVNVVVTGSDQADWSWPVELRKMLAPNNPSIRVVPSSADEPGQP